MNARIGMNPAGIGRSSRIDPTELAEIHSIPEKVTVLKPTETLKPGEKVASLLPDLALPSAVAPLTTILGKRLTSDNPVWSGDPIPNMRLLQKSLVVRSLELDADKRSDLLAAIELVEKSVQLRLRWQQMRRSEFEGPDAQPDQLQSEQIDQFESAT